PPDRSSRMAQPGEEQSRARQELPGTRRPGHEEATPSRGPHCRGRSPLGRTADWTPMIPKECKRLAEVDFPIAVVSKHSAREKSIRHGHPSTLHLWWARRPLAACRAMLMALLLPDPCDLHCPADFK